MKKGKVTAKDVAARAGVSPTTVSMILSGKNSSKFPEKTIHKVIEACNELGYIRMGSTASAYDDNVLVAIAPTYSNLYYVHMVDAMQHRAKELGYSLLTFNTFREMSQETRIIQICNQFPFAGVFFLYPLENILLMQQVEWLKPVMHIYDKGILNDADILEVDGARVGSLIAEYLIDLGHEKIAFLSSTFNTKQVTRIRRLDSLRAVYEKSGFDSSRSVLACTPETELPAGRL